VPYPITFDAILNHLTNLKQEDFDRLAEQIRSASGSAENFDLTAHIEQLRRLGAAMTPEERNDLTIIDSRRQAQIVAESGFPADRLDHMLQMFRTAQHFAESMVPIGVWRFLGLSRFRPPDRA
jgi:signal recognition particle GTPase